MRRSGCGRISRRHFLGDVGLGFTGLALNALLAHDKARPEEPARSNPPARVENVIWLFMMGGVSHLEGFDPKPALNRYAGMRISETRANGVLTDDLRDLQDFGPGLNYNSRIMPLQVGYRKRGQAGVEVSDWWPQVGSHVDDLAIVRSMVTTDSEHSAVFQFHTGRSLRLTPQPSLGSWASYGLGSLNRNLPTFVALGFPPMSHQGGPGSHLAQYLGPEHDGVLLGDDPATVLPYRPRPVHVSTAAQRREIDFIQRMNQLSAIQYPEDRQLRARIQAYETAFGMQAELPEVVDLSRETAETQRLYGLDQPVTSAFGRQCLVARRLVERGVRFVQLYHGGNPDNDSGDWDSHHRIREQHAGMCAKVDRPIAGLLSDLKRRGMLEKTLVAWVTEFGRTPCIDNRTAGGPDDESRRSGRDHHIFGFSIWLAGAGIKRGVVHGATDELGFHAVEDRHYVTDLHATILHLLGHDPRDREFQGQQRLDMDRGQVIDAILA